MEPTVKWCPDVDRTMHLEDLPALTDFMLRPVSFNVALLLSSRFKEPAWAQLWHQCCALLLLLPPSSCGCTIFVMCCLTSAYTLLYGMRTIEPFIFIQAFDATRGPDCCFIWSSTVLLEDVPEEKFLGTTCSVTQGTITTLQPVDATLLRTLKSVGNREHVLSGFSATTRHAIDTTAWRT